MTGLEMLRGVRPPAGGADDADTEAQSWLPPSARDVLVGLVTGVLSLLLVVVPTVLGWMVEPRPGASLGEPLGAAASIWLLLQGGRLGSGATTVAFVPLVLGALAVWVASRGASRALDAAEVDDELVWHLLPRSVAGVAGRWWLGYAGAIGLASALTVAGSLPVRWASLAAPLVVVPVLALTMALRRLARGADVLGPRFDAVVLPDPVRRALGPAMRGLALLLGLALLGVVAAVALRWESVTELHTEVGAGFLGGLLLVAVQLASLPNLALWFVAFLAGPGFSVVDGAHTSVSGSTSGLMPLIPVLGAVPEPGPHPWFVRLLLLVPVLVGAYLGRRSLEAVARLSSLRTKASVAAVACLLVAAAIGLLDGLGGGSLGAYRLSDVGASGPWTTLALVAELLLGALTVVAWDAWRLRR